MKAAHAARLTGLIAVAALGVGLLGWGASNLSARAQDTAPGLAGAAVPASPGAASALVARGQYLARAADCAACHTADRSRPYAGGRAFNLPFGTIYSTNLTPDRETGVGGYTDEQFVRAVRQGVRKDGAHLYPCMPYTSYTGMSRDDALAIKAYLFSLAPVRSPVRANGLTFPFNQRWGMALWNLAFFRDHRFQADSALTATQNRGKYLATALGHCGECHTPRNIAYAVKSNRQFAGEVVEGWRAYNITSDKRFGLGGWSDQAIRDYLSTGHSPGHGSASGSMGEAVENSLQYLTPQDLTSLVAYLRTVKPRAGEKGGEVNPAPPALRASAAWAPGPGERKDDLGRRIFEGACASCHRWDGQGQQSPYAALAGSQAANDPQGLNVTRVLLQGAQMRTRGETIYMPSFARGYSDVELAAVANYVVGHFGGKTGAVTAEKVHKQRAE